MAVDESGRQRAAVYAERLLGQARKDRTWLVREAELDPGTVADFLDGKRWPRTTSRDAIEKALGMDRGTLKYVAEGWGLIDPGMDEVEAAIEASEKLTRGQKLKLRGLYVDMVDGAGESQAG